MRLRRLIRILIMLLPHGVYAFLLQWRLQRGKRAVPANLLAQNAALKNRHRGERCFILGNGPSVKEIDLSALAGQIVISVSNGYLHSGYSLVCPKYHCVPQTHHPMTEDDIVRWFIEMHANLGDAVLFLNETEAELVERHGLFKGREIHYLDMRESFDSWNDRNIIDLTKSVPRVQSVPVMVLMVAMYLGFREIVLLGVDHDHFRTGRYVYAFDPQVQKGKDASVKDDGIVVTPLYDEFHSLARLWRQYRVLREIAHSNGISIFNASPSSELDEFPRVRLEDVLETRP